MEWEVKVHKKVAKTFSLLPESIKLKFQTLLLEIRYQEPVRGNWRNYSKLGNDEHHCHIKSGRPTYVCCWRENVSMKIVEVYYVGTHENASY